MLVKEYTRVLKNNIIIMRMMGHIPIIILLADLKKKGLKGRFMVEHISKADRVYINASYFFNDFKETGAVFPYGNYQNNRKLS